jgi:hypothetical protein
MNRNAVVSVGRVLGLVAAVWALVPLTASAQVCGEAERTAFQNAVNAGASEAELEQQFGKCRDTTTGVVATSTVFNNFYERINSCGLHPQARQASCDVEIRQSFGFGAFGPNPAGSTENVLFCFDCDRNGTYEFATAGSVHATNNISGTLPSWYLAAFASAANAPSTCAWGSGRAINMRVILSWAAKPSSCAYRPIWGNWLTFQSRLDP